MEFTLAWQDEKLDVLNQLRQAVGCELYTQYSVDDSIMMLTVETVKRSTRNEVATAIAYVIAGTLQTRAIENISRRALSQLTAKERDTVNMLTLYRMANKGMTTKNKGYITTIAGRVKDCLGGQPLHLEGFLCFRMRDIVQRWAKCMDEVLNKAIEEYEYREYIGILKDILTSQPSTVDCIYITPASDGSFKLADKEGISVLDGSSEFATQRGLTPEDELICSLLLKAPRKVVIMDVEDSISATAMETILQVFEGRVKMSRGYKLID